MRFDYCHLYSPHTLDGIITRPVVYALKIKRNIQYHTDETVFIVIITNTILLLRRRGGC